MGLRVLRASSVPSVFPALAAISAPDSCSSSLSARSGGGGCLQWVHRTTLHPIRSPQMITAYFVFVTVGFFVAIAASVAESVTTTRAFA